MEQRQNDMEKEIMNGQMKKYIVDRFDDEDNVFVVGTYIARGIMRMGEE